MNVNELIDFNINRINNGEDVRELELKGLDKKTLSNSMCSTLFKKLRSESLIDTDQNDRIYLLSRAYEIINYGGWNKYIKKSEKEKIELIHKNDAKEKLEIDNLKLQKEAFEYQKSIRIKEDQIRNLTSDNLRLGNWDIRFRWYIALISFIIGFIIKYFIDN
ncbi:hypothetical protein FFWV33_15840 [Flavobacterium faecale]|uniref:Uncharacterized protein n=1 Tax=Flavobacterium faecale TaxID=1355330 RepID=A0A2S1LGW2_9FLAO|nr:hypothetical protein [Flavobacterium faecale]AWG22891.1 hypothetical protein FFWV33_15840 [Flavobacterium faecale]